MTEPADPALAKQVAAALRDLPEPVRVRFVRNSGYLDDTTARELAGRLADPAFLRGAVRTLDGPARAALRLLAKLTTPVVVRDLDALADLLAPQPDAPGTASRQLCAAGLAAVDDQRPPHLRTLAPLRARLAALAHEPAPALDEPVSEAEETLLEHTLAFRAGLALAAVESARPRATRYRDLHKGDAAALVELLAPAFDRPEDVTELLGRFARDREFVDRDGRFALRPGALDGWDDPPARMVVDAFQPWRHDTPLLVALDRLLAEDRWHALPNLAESLAISLLRQTFTGGAASAFGRSVEALRRFPGVHVRLRDGVEFFRLTRAARRAFGEEVAGPVPASVPLLVQPNLQVVAQLGTPVEALAGLGRIARLASTGRAAVFVLDETAIRRAAVEGFPASRQLAFLERFASRGVPSTVARALGDWGRAKGAARILTGTVVVTDLPETELSRLASGAPLQRLAEGVWLVPEESARGLAATLRRHGVSTEEGDSEHDARDEEPDPWRERARRIATAARREAARGP